jgi:hypothetical protein
MSPDDRFSGWIAAAVLIFSIAALIFLPPTFIFEIIFFPTFPPATVNGTGAGFGNAGGSGIRPKSGVIGTRE